MTAPRELSCLLTKARPYDQARIYIDNVNTMNVGCAGVMIAVGSRRLSSKIDDEPGDYASCTARARKASKKSRALLDPRRVTPEMKAAGVRAFLAGADTAKLGRALADVFEAMAAAEFEYDDDGW